SILVCVRDAVWTSFVNDELAARDELVRDASGDIDRYDLIVIAVHDERRNVELLQVRPEIRFRERFDRIESVLVTALHTLTPEGLDQALRSFCARPVEAEERPRCNVEIEL